MEAEGAGIDASEDYFAGTASGYFASGMEGAGYGGRAGASAGERDGTVGAEVVAAVLDFEEGAGAVAEGVLRGEGGEGLGGLINRIARINRITLNTRINRSILIIQSFLILEECWEEVFAVVAEHEADAGELLELFSGHLGEAADDGYLGFGVGAVGLADGVAALLLGGGGDGAGVDEVEVGGLGEVDDGVAAGGDAA